MLLILAQGNTGYPYEGNSIMKALLPDSTLSEDELGTWISSPMPEPRVLGALGYQIVV
jgi:hypothetical protein